jgi:hypothetical protein
MAEWNTPARNAAIIKGPCDQKARWVFGHCWTAEPGGLGPGAVITTVHHANKLYCSFQSNAQRLIQPRSVRTSRYLPTTSVTIRHLKKAIEGQIEALADEPCAPTGPACLPAGFVSVNRCSIYSVQGFEKRKKCLPSKLRECKDAGVENQNLPGRGEIDVNQPGLGPPRQMPPWE